MAGFSVLIWSNLCTRHIQNKLTPRGHHDWPDKRPRRGRGSDTTRGVSSAIQKLSTWTYSPNRKLDLQEPVTRELVAQR